MQLGHTKCACCKALLLRAVFAWEGMLVFTYTSASGP